MAYMRPPARFGLVATPGVPTGTPAPDTVPQATVTFYVCERCGHEWYPRGAEQHLTDEQKDEVREIVREEWVFSLMETSSPWTDERKSLYLREMNDRLRGKIR